ncbi:Gluconate transport-inducing protein [Conoideocrella luteorostrata]|uniref:Gluconate transport-inducing protein n=1 Tax=Conoideocrella luteorostrata TaxID=1105319 RepID=A0AAJ0FSQ9_9HYPO|nr:Gluconate transport-inducing protein [Conoideocrella luteorostrata]
METYHGYVRSPADAIKLFEACRQGLLPRVQRRLSEKERQSIRSGSVFVWDEREAGMRRWTDGKSWSASRVSGSFLTYREMEGKRGGGFGSGRRGAGKTPDSGRGSDEDHDDGEPEGYRYKADGLMKQSFSITTSEGHHLHLISYYSRPQPGQQELPLPSQDPSLRAIVPPKGMYPESSMGETNQTPALTRAPMQQPYMIAPQHAHAHQQAYAHYPQPGYWPPSPAATPPYGHYAPAHYPSGANSHALPPPHAAYQAPPPPQPSYSQSYYTHAPPPSQYDRPSLPPLQHSKPATHPPYHAGPSPPRHPDSPGYKERQGSHGPLPALNSVAAPVSHPAMTPPTREHSASPPKAAHDGIMMNASHRLNLSALLHPASDSPIIKSESNGSGSSSPRTSGALLEQGGVSEDARALRMLDRKFCI